VSWYEKFWRPVFIYASRQGTLDSAAIQTRNFFIRLPQAPKGRLREFIKQKLREISVDGSEDHPDFPPLSPTAWPAAPEGLSPEDAFDREWANSLLTDALYELKRDPGYEALNRCVLADAPKSFSQCAQELGISTDEARSRVFQARGKLRAILWRRVLETVPSRSEVESELDGLLKTLEDKNVAKILSHLRLLEPLAVLEGWIDEGQLQEALKEHRSTHQPFEEILVDRRWITAEQLARLEKMERDLVAFDACGGISEDSIKRRVAGYAFIDELGAGGAGKVWKAWDTRLQRWVAIKEPNQAAGPWRERFRREALAAAKLRHPNLVEVFEVVQNEGVDLIVMNFVEGKPLDELLPPADNVAKLMAEVCDAVQYMHEQGVFHRDIKPQNIIVDAAGKGYLGDFGLAKIAGHRALTIEGTVMGTPEYMAPEQASGKDEWIGPRTDVYGLGATLYHALTGQAPFDGQDDFSTLCQKLINDAPVSPRKIKPAVPVELESIVMHAMAKHPLERYATAAQMAEDLRRFLRGEMPLARPSNVVTRSMKWARRNRMPTVAMILALIGVGLAIGLWLYYSSVRSREQAYQSAYQEGIELWMQAVGHTRGPVRDRDRLLRTAQQAAAKFEAAATSLPQRAEPWLMRGRCMIIMGKGDEAEHSWTRALELQAEFGPALFERGKYYLGTYVRLKPGPGIRVARGRVRSGPSDAESDDEKQWREKGERDLARARGAKGLEPAALRYLEGTLAFADGRYKDAAEAIRSYTLENPWDAPALTLQGMSTYLGGDLVDAEDSFSRAIALEPMPHRFKARGDVRYCLGKFEGAVEDYSQAGNTPEAICNRGMARHAAGQLDAALKDFEEAIAWNPKFARAYNARGTVHHARLDLDAAQRDFQKAVELHPFYAEAYNNLGTVLVLMGEFDEGIETYGLALNVDADYADAYANRAVANLSKGRPQEAIDDYQRAIARHSNPEWFYQLGLLLKNQDRVPDARARLQQALDNAPAGWPRRKTVEELLQQWK
jgi:serine/threonine protein kinase/Tfp pilus assembly protein PilF